MFRGEGYDTDDESSIFSAIQVANSCEDAEKIHFLINPNVIAILSVTSRKAFTVTDISKHISLPLATCYKLVEQLMELGMVARIGTTRTSSRGRAANYTSTIRAIQVNMTDTHVEAWVTFKSGQKDHFKRDFLPID